MRSEQKLIYDPPPLRTVLYLPGLPGFGTRIYDRSPYGNHGAITGAVWKFNGRIWYPNFSGGDDSVDFGDPASLDITTTLSVLIWHKNAVADLTGNNVLLSKYKAAGNQREWTFVLLSTEKIRFYATDDGVAAAGHAMNCNSDSAVSTLNAWNLYGLTFNAGTVVMSLNGASIAFTNSGDAITSLFNGTGKLIMGNIDGGTDWLYGDAALGLIVNGILSPAFVTSWYQQTRHLLGV